MRSGISEEEESILKTVFNRRNAYLRAHCLVLFRTQTVGSAQASTDGLADLRDALAGHGWKCADYANIEEFGRLGTAHLQRWLEQEIGEQVESWIDRVSPAQ